MASQRYRQAVLVLPADRLEAMVAHCVAGYPLEACGLLVGRTEGADAVVARCAPAGNEAHSARVYTVAPRDLLAADRQAEAEGLEIVGVYHSHTHTDAQPSPTDVAQAPDPSWHYVLVSLRDLEPAVRSWRIEAGKIHEEAVVLQ